MGGKPYFFWKNKNCENARKQWPEAYTAGYFYAFSLFGYVRSAASLDGSSLMSKKYTKKETKDISQILARNPLLSDMWTDMPKHNGPITINYGYKRLMEPQKNPEDILEQTGELTCVQMTIFIRNQGNSKLTMPHMIKFWYDPETNIWHPYLMCTKYINTPSHLIF